MTLTEGKHKVQVDKDCSRSDEKDFQQIQQRSVPSKRPVDELAEGVTTEKRLRVQSTSHDLQTDRDNPQSEEREFLQVQYVQTSAESNGPGAEVYKCIVEKETTVLQTHSESSEDRGEFTFTIQSLYRYKQNEGDGNLLMAAENHKERNDSFDVNFKGTDPNTEATVFYAKRQHEEHRGRNDVFTLRCNLKNENYYLLSEGKEIFLQKCGKFSPRSSKYEFQLSSPNKESCYKTIKSVHTGLYLECEENGRAIMTEVCDEKDGQSHVGGSCSDRRAWLKLNEKASIVQRR